MDKLNKLLIVLVLSVMLASAAAADIGVGASMAAFGPLYSLSYHNYKTGLGIEAASSLGETGLKDMLSIFLSVFGITDPVNVHLYSLALTQDFFKAGNGQLYFKAGAFLTFASVMGKQSTLTLPLLGLGYEYRGIFIPNLSGNLEIIYPLAYGIGLKAYF